jgi:hypothetical protein
VNENLHPESDPLVDWLAEPPTLTPAGALEQTVWRRTQSVLRRRRWLRRTGYAAALAACYVAGLLTMKYLPASPAAPPPAVAHTEIRPEPPAVTRPEEVPPPRPSGAEPASPAAIEWQAVDSREQRPDLYRQAGDRYLEAGDIQSAIRCYRNMLDAAPEEDQAISPTNDNWLVIALKGDRQKEKRRAKQDG